MFTIATIHLYLYFKDEADVSSGNWYIDTYIYPRKFHFLPSFYIVYHLMSVNRLFYIGIDCL